MNYGPHTPGPANPSRQAETLRLLVAERNVYVPVHTVLLTFPKIRHHCVNSCSVLIWLVSFRLACLGPRATQARLLASVCLYRRITCPFLPSLTPRVELSAPGGRPLAGDRVFGRYMNRDGRVRSAPHGRPGRRTCTHNRARDLSHRARVGAARFSLGLRLVVIERDMDVWIDEIIP